ncbi:hypothetical protein BGZ65_009735 [Modicella reniformis]|uniref:Uncharacterized protein n=1 Tax=Modicella reniformis TaxID=1440133 RepID=A0A9P6MKK9_9FUNG|nr:hypothetical protein BGZ65_009735 [Modicella reniformis]
MDPETFPWVDMPNPPVSIHITNLTMTYSRLAPTLTPSWIDCFATDDGRIVLVGGNFQVLVYTIATSTWSDTVTPASSLKFGPSVSSNMFLNPVYIQSKILADGFTALVVCTLSWNSQPQPYYLNTRTWTVTLAIGTSQTTPASSSSSSSGWGSIPGGGTLLPPAGFRHYTLAILGQDKAEAQNHYGNGRAFIIGGYSTLVTGQVQDWDALTSFPVQQAPSNGKLVRLQREFSQTSKRSLMMGIIIPVVVIMFGNAGTLSKPTRGSVAYPISSSLLDIFPGNGGDSGTQQRIEVFDKDSNTLTTVSGVTGGPRNTIFRGATVIGQGQQVLVHGGLVSLEFDSSQPSILVKNLDQSIVVWNGDSRQWGDTVNIYVSRKSKGLMIGLIAGGIALLILLGLGIWYFRRWQRMRRLEEEERQAKGMVLKNEEKLQKDHRTDPHNNEDPSLRAGTVIHATQGEHLSAESSVYGALRQPSHGYLDELSTGRNSTHSQYPYAEAESVGDHFTAQTSGKRRTVHGPQEYPPSEVLSMDSSRGVPLGMPSHYQSVVTVPGYPVYGMAADSIAKQEQSDPSIVGDTMLLNLLLSRYGPFFWRSYGTHRTDGVKCADHPIFWPYNPQADRRVLPSVASSGPFPISSQSLMFVMKSTTITISYRTLPN